MKSKTTHKLDIFQVLGSLSKKIEGFYTKLDDDEKKALQPLVVMRWLSGTKDARQIYFLNELVNPFVFSLAKHKELLVDLMSVSSSGKMQRYQWIKNTSKKTSSTPHSVEVIKEYFTYSTSEAVEVLPLLSVDVIIDYAEQLGKQPDYIKLLKRELSIKK